MGRLAAFVMHLFSWVAVSTYLEWWHSVMIDRVLMTWIDGESCVRVGGGVFQRFSHVFSPQTTFTCQLGYSLGGSPFDLVIIGITSPKGAQLDSLGKRKLD